MSTVVIIDGHPGFRDRLETFVREQDGCSVAGLAGDTPTGLRVVSAARPDVVLIDVGLADGGGLRLAQQIVSLQLGIRIVLMGENEMLEYEPAATRAGAIAYVSKTEISQILPALLGSPAKPTTRRAPVAFDARGGLVAQAVAGSGAWSSAASSAALPLRYAGWEAMLSAAVLASGIALSQPAGALAGALGFAFLSYRQMTLPRFHGGQLGGRVLRRTRGAR